MAQVPGLVRRGSAYSYRRRVPDELRTVVGKLELWIGLGTTDYRAACVAARHEATRIDRLFEDARNAARRGEAFSPLTQSRVSESELQRVAIAELWKIERVAAYARPVPEGLSRGEWVSELEGDIGTFQDNDANSRAVLLARAVQLIQFERLPIEIPLLPSRSAGLAKHDVASRATPELLRLIELLRRVEIEI